jgi:hypothetical protein
VAQYQTDRSLLGSSIEIVIEAIELQVQESEATMVAK